MAIIGLTGGIGSGKTLIASVFEVLDVPIYSADLRARQLSNEDPHIINAIKTTFGKEAYLEDGRLNRPYIASRVFNNPKELTQLNNIIHPAVRIDTEKWLLKHSNKAYVIKEAAIMFESGAYRECDEIICVYADMDIRIDRVMKRDNVDRETVMARMNNQFDPKFVLSLSDYLILNDGSKPLIQQIINLHNHLSELYGPTIETPQ